MTDAEAIEILARWVFTLRVDLHVAQVSAHSQRAKADQLTRQLRVQNQANDRLKAELAGYAFWMKSGLTPLELHEAARELDPAVVGAAA